MTKAITCCVSLLALVAVTAPTRSAEAGCEASMQKLDASQTEGDERLAEKDAVVGTCASQYKSDKTIKGLVKECMKYEEQPIVKQQFLADCELAAYNYANALYALKAEYGK